MLHLIYLSFIVFIISFIGSLNGLGVSFLLSLALLFLGPHEHTSILWILYGSSFIVASFFVLTRPRLVFENIYAIFLLSLFCGMGLLLGKIIISHHEFHFLKMTFGISLIVFYLLLKNSSFSRATVSDVYESKVTFNFLDLLIFFGIGFCAGFFDFGIAAFIYVQMFLKNKFYNVEKIDICVYFVLIVTSIINLFNSFIRYEQILPSYVGISYLGFILAGAILARLIYKMISLDIRRSIVIYGILFVGIKISLLSFNIEGINKIIFELSQKIMHFAS